MALFAAAYFALARGSLWFVLQPDGLALVWPLSGLALSALLLCRRSEWRRYAAIVFVMNTLANATGGNGWLTAMAFAGANTMEPLLGAWVLLRVAGPGVTFSTVRQVLALALVAGVANGATALLGAAVPAVAFGAVYRDAWLTWWVADGVGTLLVTPLIVVWATTGNVLRVTTRRRQLEAVALIAVLLVTGLAVFASKAAGEVLGSVAQETYVVVPVLLWGALRFPRCGNVTMMAVLMVLAVGGLAHGVGPLFDSSALFHRQILSMQLFLATMSLSMQVVAAAWFERRAGEVHLRRSEQALRQAQRVARVGSWAWHVRTNRLEWSEEMYRIFGLDPVSFSADLQDVVARSIHPDDRPAVEQSNLSVSRDGVPVPLEYRVVRPDGSTRAVWAEAGVLHRDEVGNPEMLTGIVQDITERKAAEKALRESEARFRALVEQAGDGFELLDGDGRYLNVNTAACRQLGYSKDELLRLSVLDVDPLVSLELYRTQFAAWAEQPAVSFETVHRRRDGTTFPVEVTVSVVRLGSDLRAVSLVRDITTRKQAEQQLLLLKRAIDAHSDGAYWMDRANRFVYVNRAGCQAVEYTLEELQGQTIDLINPSVTAERMEQVWELLRRDGSVLLEGVHRRKDGSLFPAEILATYVVADGVEFNCGFARDVTARKQAEEALWQSERRYRELFESSPNPIWEEDFSAVRAYLDGLGTASPRELRAYLESHPEEVMHLASLVKVIDVNPCSAAFFGESDTAAVIRALPAYFGEASLPAFREELLALAAGALQFSGEIPIRTPRGGAWRDLLLWVSVAPDSAQTWSRVLVSFVDITERKRAEQWLAQEHHREQVMGQIGGQILALSDLHEVATHLQDQWLQALRRLGLPVYHISVQAPVSAAGYYTLIWDSVSVRPHLADAQYPVARCPWVAEAQRADALVVVDQQRLIELDFPGKEVRTLVEVPLPGGGSLGVSSQVADAFDENALRVLSQFAGLVATAMRRLQDIEALRQSQGQLDAIVRTVPDIIYRLDPGGRITFINDAVRRYGYTPEELCGRDVLDLIHPEDRSGAAHHLKERRTGDRRTRSFEVRLLPKATAPRVFEVVSAVVAPPVVMLLDSEGVYTSSVPQATAFTGTQGVAHDITERKQAEEALKESERFARSTVDALSEHLAILDETGAIVAVNHAWRRFAAANGGELSAVAEGANYLTVCEAATGPDAASATAFANGIRAVLAGTQPTYIQEYACHSETGQRWFVGRVTRFAGNGATRVVVAHQNVTDRRRSAEALRESQERFAKVFYRSPALMSLSRLDDGRLVDVNDQFCLVSGFTREEAVGRTTLELGWLTPEGRQGAIAQMSPDGTAQGVELSCRAKDGRPIRCLCHAEVMMVGGERLLLSLGLDVTEQRRVTAELEHQRLRAVQVDRLQALGEMATGIAHELNQPLNGIRAFAEGLLLAPQMGWAPTPEETHQTLRDIVTQVDRITGIIDHMRVFARDEGAVGAQTFQVGDCVTGALKLMSAQLRVHGIAVRNESTAMTPACYGWPNALEQVLLNLLSNARDALDERLQRQRGGDASIAHEWRPEIAISVALASDGKTVDLSVADNGGGIDEKILPRVFDPFYTTKAAGKGTGIGLSIARTIVERHHGKIQVDNRPGAGVTFRVILPAAEPVATEPDDATPA
jgi:PAS domain S-box-containing protein